jgi:para-nitrobenzyl esterase
MPEDAMSDGPIVEIASGRVRGSWDHGVARFLGVPYGADTSGAARFRPPRPVPPWTGIRPALAFGPVAPQAPNALIDPTAQTMSEDCLVLNVWTPACDDAARPVLVWLHGGGYYAGSPVGSTTHGAALAREHDLVVVSVHHRLGLMGFLDLDDLGEEFAGSGNASMLDLVAALTWVRDNIARFGGAPSAVTIFGHSGGGGKVTTLLTMPAARGLFRGAAVHGGPSFDLNSVEKAQRTTEEVLALADLTPAEATRLREMPLARLIDLQVRMGVGGRPGPRGLLFAPVVGRAEVPADPNEALACGVSAGIPLLVGTCLDEARYAMLTNAAYRDPEFTIDDHELAARVTPGIDDRGQVDELIARYRAIAPGFSNVALLFMISSDQFRIRTLRLAQARLAGGGAAPFVYLCEINRDHPLGAFHSVEMPFFFNTVAAGTRIQTTAAREALGLRISASLAAFARAGSPSCDSAGSWPAFDSTERQHLVFDDGGIRVVADPHSDRRRVWDGIVTGRRSNPWARLAI